MRALRLTQRRGAVLEAVGRRGTARILRVAAVVCLLGAAGGCGWTTDPAGPAAARVSRLWWFMLGLGVLTLAVVVAATALAAARKPSQGGRRGPGHVLIVGGGIVLPALVLVTLMVTNVGQMRAIDHGGELTVEVTGHKWWWEVGYPGTGALTANEIHIPVDTPVELRLRSADVIHSFWVPELGGKMDLVPGHDNSLVIEADRPGVYTGACAEYCGLQHANMRLVVVAEPTAAFEAWLRRESAPATEPASASARRGEDVFMTAACVGCHTIRGTPADARLGPDLTHLASRRTLGAGIVPNTRGHLGGWIVNAQTFKPGNEMPPVPIPPQDLQPLLDYLESLE